MLHVTQAQNPNPQNPPIVVDQHANSTHLNSTLRWEWIEGLGRVMITGELRETSGSNSSTHSDSGTIAMFNLDKRNENQPEWIRRHAWGGRQTQEASNTLIEPVVRDVNRDGLHFALEDLTQWAKIILGPNLLYIAQARTVSLGTGLDNITNLGPNALGPIQAPHSPTPAISDLGILSSLNCGEGLEGNWGTSKKRIGSEMGRLGRNLRQKLLCGFCIDEGVVKF